MFTVTNDVKVPEHKHVLNEGWGRGREDWVTPAFLEGPEWSLKTRKTGNASLTESTAMGDYGDPCLASQTRSNNGEMGIGYCSAIVRQS